MPAKRPLPLSSSSRGNVEQDETHTDAKVTLSLLFCVDVEKRIIEDKENKSRPAGKKAVNERKTSSTLTTMYSDDEGNIVLPKRRRY
jgi:hypothetical protein